MIVQDDRGSLLTKGSLYNHFYRADARHEISCWKARIFVSQSVQSGSLSMGMVEQNNPVLKQYTQYVEQIRYNSAGMPLEQAVEADEELRSE